MSTLQFLAAPLFHDVQETLHMSLLPPVEHVVDFEFEKCFADGDSVGHLAVEKLGTFWALPQNA